MLEEFDWDLLVVVMINRPFLSTGGYGRHQNPCS